MLGTANAGLAGTSGKMRLTTGTSSLGNTGTISLATGTASKGRAGQVELRVGQTNANDPYVVGNSITMTSSSTHDPPSFTQAPER